MIRLLPLFLLIICPPLQAERISQDDPSPYVRMHVNDLVKWQQWDRSVLERAQKENKLIIISSGYYACHWCHVMRRESFNERQVARLINSQFIPVKIDRELFPVLDAYLIEFLRNTQGYGGWPLNVVVTPQGHPLTGMAYLPRNDFLAVLKRLDEKWRAEPAKLSQIALNTYHELERMQQRPVSVSDADLFDLFMYAVNGAMDELQGGFGDQAKFPRPHLMMVLLQIYAENGGDELKEFIELTLQQMASQGLHDMVGGGFFRYTTDPTWQQPHFEKMLYTNAAMIRLYVTAYRVLGDRRWLQLAFETMEFVLREMRDGKGGFVSALSAQDKNGEEGGRYLWERGTLEKLVGKQALGKMQLGLMVPGGKLLPMGMWLEPQQQALKNRLLKKRRLNPAVRDEKMVIAWNAYLLGSMVELMSLDDSERYRGVAAALYKRLTEVYVDRQKSSQVSLLLQDYVFMAEAFIKWQAYSGEELKIGVEPLIEATLRQYVARGGWNQSKNSLLPMPGNPRNLTDGDLPAADVVLRSLLHELPVRYQERLMRRQGDMKPLDRRVLEQPMDYATLVLERLRSGRKAEMRRRDDNNPDKKE